MNGASKPLVSRLLPSNAVAMSMRGGQASRVVFDWLEPSSRTRRMSTTVSDALSVAPISIADVQAARERVAPYLTPTPLRE